MRHAPIIPSLSCVREWAPEVAVSEELARRLIACQFPQVRLDSIALLGEGWDNTVWLVDGRWAFRFPRREFAIPGVERELAALPVLAPLLPLPIPAPVFAGAPTEEFPWPWFGAAHIPGTEPLGLGEAERRALARPLARFLRALHTASVPGLPADPMRRADMAIRVPATEAALAGLETEGMWSTPPTIAPLLAEARELPPAEATVVAHGDLHVRHLVVDGAGGLTGVIDWGDVCRGDPSIDLSLLWSLLGPGGRADFIAEYGSLTAAQLLRARVLAIFLSAVLALYGHHEGMAALRDEALLGLERATA